MGWNRRSAFSLLIITPSGGFTGLFVYVPGPGANNLRDSVTGAAGTDPFGNTFLPNYVAYGAGVATQHNQLGLAWFSQGASQSSPLVFVGSFQQLAGLNAVQLVGAGPATGEVWVFPSNDATGVTDSANLATIFTMTTVVHLTPGVYFLASPLAIPDQAALIGPNPSWGIPTGNYGSAGLPLQGAILKPVAAFSGASVISFGTAGTTQHGGQRLGGITIDGSLISGANTIDGIQSVDFVGGVKLTDVVVWGGHTGAGGLGGHGLHLTNTVAGRNPDFWQVTRCKFSNVGSGGVHINAPLSDSWFTDCEATGNVANGWDITNGNETRFTKCRGDSNGGEGMDWSGVVGFTGKTIWDCCSFNSNTGHGVNINGGGTGTIVMTTLTSDGNTGGQFIYAGTNNWKTDAAYNTSVVAPTFA